VGSGADPDEQYRMGTLDPPPAVVVTTEGARGGAFVTDRGEAGRWQAAAPPGPIRDAYGAGDSFAAALAVGLGRDLPLRDALDLAARAGAAALCRRGGGGGKMEA
jgi:ribokinase